MKTRTRRFWKYIFVLCASLPVLYVVLFATVYFTLGKTPAIALLTHGGAVFVPVSRDSSHLSPSIRLALDGRVHQAVAGPFAWHEDAPGFQTGELPVLSDDREADRILLARVDPAQFRIIARNDPSAFTTADSWLEKLHANLVVNGSYYATTGLPDTPFVEDGKHIGPAAYDARQGAFVISGGGAAIADLSRTSWQEALAGASDALVSYPLLLGNDGKARAIKPTMWLANRTFVGLDQDGWVVFGTTTDAFFSLARFAAFLETSTLRLRGVLNLDGGPLACQAIKIRQFSREFCGEYEVQSNGRDVKKLMWFYGKAALPVVLAAVPRERP